MYGVRLKFIIEKRNTILQMLVNFKSCERENSIILYNLWNINRDF